MQHKGPIIKQGGRDSHPAARLQRSPARLHRHPQVLKSYYQRPVDGVSRFSYNPVLLLEIIEHVKLNPSGRPSLPSCWGSLILGVRVISQDGLRNFPRQTWFQNTRVTGPIGRERRGWTAICD